MIRTFSARLRVLGRSSIGRPVRAATHACGRLIPTRRSLASEAGDTLIEVLASAVLVALIVVAMFNGFDSASRASAGERSRAQADALAQQAEDQLRGLSTAALTELEAKPRVEEPKENGTTYKVTSTAQYVTDATATVSCNSSATSGSYIRTTSTVTWGSLGVRKPVVESSIISPPPGSALIVQVTNASSEGVAGMTVVATGPAPATTTTTLATAASGCATLALLPGEYAINVSQTGYVDQNWYPESKEDPSSIHSVYLTAENTIKEPYRFDKAGILEAEFTTESASSEGDSFVAFNTGMNTPAFRQIGKLETYEKKIKSSTTVFPFAATKYSIYAGTCEQNNPHTVNPANAQPSSVLVLPGKTVLDKEVIQPPINIRVMSGTKAGAEGLKIENATGTLVEPKEPEGCGATHKFTTTKEGALPHPGMPFAEYTLCVTGGVSGGNNGATKGLAKEQKYTTTFENNTAAGPSGLATMTNGGVVEEPVTKKKVAVIYMGSGAPTSPGKLESGKSSCP